MMIFFRTTASWLADHWSSIALAWSIVSAALSALWRAIPEATRSRLALRYPRLDALARIVRKAGLDLLPVLSETVRVLTGRQLTRSSAEPELPRRRTPTPPPSAGLMALVALVASGCAAHPWHVTARAVLNSHAYGLAAVDGVTASLIADDHSTQSERESRWGPVVAAERATLEALRSAERLVDSASAVDSASDRCTALLAVRVVVIELLRAVRVLRELGAQIPDEVSRAADFARALAPLIVSAECSPQSEDSTAER